MIEPTPTDLVLRVRPISQHGLLTTDDPHDNRACWYAAALMVLGYRGPLPPLELVNLRTLARLWKNHGIMPQDLWRLADEAGLEHAAAKALLPRMGAAEWRNALSTLGPLIVVTGMHAHGQHAVVVTGVVRQGEGWAIVHNDPFTGMAVTTALLRFNGGVEWRLPMLYRRSGRRPPIVLRQPVEAPYDARY